MENLCEWTNAVSNLELGWINQWCYIDNRDVLMSLKKQALKNKKAIKEEGYDVNDVYKQLEDFESCISRQAPSTDFYEEKIILAALEYANQNRAIIISKMNSTLSLLDTPEEKEKNALRYKFDVSLNLIGFYINYLNCIDIYENVIEFIKFTEFLASKYPHDKNHYNCTGIVIDYLKELIKSKNSDKAFFILEKFTLEPLGKTEAKNLDKIKEKLEKTK